MVRSLIKEFGELGVVSEMCLYCSFNRTGNYVGNCIRGQIQENLLKKEVKKLKVVCNNY